RAQPARPSAQAAVSARTVRSPPASPSQREAFSGVSEQADSRPPTQRSPPPLGGASADLHPEELAPTERLPADLALDGESRDERRRARGTAVPELAAARRAHRRQLLLELLEPALRAAALDAES